MFLVGLGSSLALVYWSEQDRAPIRPLIVLGFHLLGYLLTASALLLGRDGLRWLFALCAQICCRPRTGLKGVLRGSNSLADGSSWALLLLSGCLVGWGHLGARRTPRVIQIAAPIRNLPRAFEGYRIVHLTDIHLRGAPDRERLRQLITQVNSLEADLIALTGDIVDGPLDNLRLELAPLGDLRATDGVVAVVGNHEYYADVDAFVGESRRLGIRVLLDDHETLVRGIERMVVAGVVNPQRGMHGSNYAVLGSNVAELKSDPAAAIAGAPRDKTRILLAHQPQSVVMARELGFDLALTGHTHGGQFFPWSLVVRSVSPYVPGLSLDGAMWVHLGSGLGTFGPPLRLGTVPEVTVLTLRPSP
jgi:predicted MPP superfamily phosphohydrolase